MTQCFTSAEAADRLRICKETLLRMVRVEGVPHRRVGRKVLFTESDLAAILESKSMRGEVNPFARKPKTTVSENTNNEQQPTNQSDGGSAVANAIADTCGQP